jgi:hypothetical protein
MARKFGSLVGDLKEYPANHEGAYYHPFQSGLPDEPPAPPRGARFVRVAGGRLGTRLALGDRIGGVSHPLSPEQPTPEALRPLGRQLLAQSAGLAALLF